MIKFFRLMKLNFVIQNQRSDRLPIAIGMVEIATCGKLKTLKYD